MQPFLRPETFIDWTTSNEEGCKLEISASIEGRVHQLISIVTDPSDGTVRVELYPDRKKLQIPLDDVHRLLESVPQLEEWHHDAHLGSLH